MPDRSENGPAAITDELLELREAAGIGGADVRIGGVGLERAEVRVDDPGVVVGVLGLKHGGGDSAAQ